MKAKGRRVGRRVVFDRIKRERCRETKKKSWEEPAKSRKMDLTSNKEKLTTATGICTKTENSEKARGERSARAAGGMVKGDAKTGHTFTLGAVLIQS